MSTQTSPSHSIIGRTLGGVTIESLLGEGGFAWIFRGRRDAQPSEVAVKVLNPELTADPTFVKRFVREAETAISVAHPNAVQIFDYGADGELVYIVMELVRGRGLMDVLTSDKRLTQRRAAKIVAQMCDALEVAHDQGIVHRDIKPENVMLLGDPSQPMGEWVKVLDFGIAKLVLDGSRRANESDPPDATTALTRLGTVIGTPEYMSPEQAKGAQVDGRCDVYACGVLLYHLVTGRLPFQGATAMHTAMLHVEQPPPPPTTFAPDLDSELEKIILKALAKAPQDRQRNARELRDALTRLVPSLSDVTEPVVDRSAIATAATVAAMPAATPAQGADSPPQAAPIPPEVARQPTTVQAANLVDPARRELQPAAKSRTRAMLAVAGFVFVFAVVAVALLAAR